MKKLLLMFFLFFVACQSQYMTGGKVYIQSKQFDKAIEQFKLAIEAEPNNYLCYLWLGHAYGYNAMWKDAATQYIKALDVNKEKATKDMMKDADTYWQTFYNAAIVCLKDTVNIEQSFNEALKFLGYSLNFATSSNSKAASLVIKGTILQNQGKNEEAFETFKDVLANDPKNPLGNRALGNYYFFIADYDNAIKYFKTAYEVDSNNIEVVKMLGASYLDAKKYDEATKIFTRQTILTPDDGVAYFNLGLSYLFNGFQEEGITNLYTSIEKLKAVGDIEIIQKVYITLAEIFYERKDYKKALDTANELLKINPSNCEGIKIIYNTYVDMKDRKNAKQYLKKVEDCLKSGE